MGWWFGVRWGCFRVEDEWMSRGKANERGGEQEGYGRHCLGR